MRESFVRKLTAVVAGAILATCRTAGLAYALYDTCASDTFSYTSGSITYQYFNSGSVYLDSCYNAETSSSMYVRNYTSDSEPYTIGSRAALITGDWLGDEYTLFGDEVININGSERFRYMTSTVDKDLNQINGVGDVGAMAWGEGWVVGSGGSRVEVSGGYLLLVTLDANGNYITGWTVGASPTSASATSETWVPGSANFTGVDGRVYGVPYVDESGTVVAPDMFRVKLEDGQAAYVSSEEMDAAVINGAETPEEIEAAIAQISDLEARAFQQAFKDYYGIDALSYDAALSCAINIRYVGGMESSIAIMKDDTGDDLAAAARSGSTSNPNVLRVIGVESPVAISSIEGEGITATDISISEEDINAIFELARPHLVVTVPAYASDGVTVIGEFSFGRL